MVRDEESGKISAFFVAPVKRGYYVAGYVIAAIIVSFIMCLLTLIIGVIYLGIANGSFIAAHDTLEILLIPPIITSPTQTVTIIPATTTLIE